MSHPAHAVSFLLLTFHVWVAWDNFSKPFADLVLRASKTIQSWLLNPVCHIPGWFGAGILHTAWCLGPLWFFPYVFRSSVKCSLTLAVPPVSNKQSYSQKSLISLSPAAMGQDCRSPVCYRATTIQFLLSLSYSIQYGATGTSNPCSHDKRVAWYTGWEQAEVRPFHYQFNP